MHWSNIPAASLAVLRHGTVIPAHLLALDANRQLDAQRQRAMTRYYLDAGAGGVAVGVHSTQFAIRQARLYPQVLELAMQTALDWTPLGGKRPLFTIAGLAGKTTQAVAEATTVRALGYHAGLLSRAAYSQNARTLQAYCALLDHGRFPVVRGIALTRDDLVRRAVINALICQGLVVFESIDLAYLVDFSSYFATEMMALRELAAQGLVTLDSAGIALTDEGRFFAPTVAMVFDRYLQNDRLRTRYTGII